MQREGIEGRASPACGNGDTKAVRRVSMTAVRTKGAGHLGLGQLSGSNETSTVRAVSLEGHSGNREVYPLLACLGPTQISSCSSKVALLSFYTFLPAAFPQICDAPSAASRETQSPQSSQPQQAGMCRPLPWQRLCPRHRTHVLSGALLQG